MNNNKADISVKSSLDKCQSFDNNADIPVKSSLDKSQSFDNKVDIPVLSSLDKCQSFDNKTDISVKSSPNQSNSFAKNNSLGTQGKATSRSQTKRPSKFGLISLLVLGLTGVLTFEPMIGQIPAAQAQAVPAAARRGFTLLQQGLVNDAIAAFKQAIANSPQSLDAKLGLAQAYQKAGKDSEA
ncbi:MAG: tetratricopeptide repeat protein, partial [Coleofasciculaceae cyanobacterium]